MSGAWGSPLKARTVGCEGDKDTICARGFTIAIYRLFSDSLECFNLILIY